MNRHLHKSFMGAVLGGAVVAIAASNGGCSAADAAKDAVNNVEQATSGCDEFSQGDTAVANLSIDGDTKAFVSASADLATITATAESNILTACIGIDTDLQITDTWTAMKTASGNIDAEVKEACTQASNKISAVLQGDASAGCELVISRGYCTVDEQAQVACESSCTTNTTCMPGDITMLCMPAELTGECSGTCNAGAACEGSVSAQATCMGQCEADCTGMCDNSPCQGTHCKGSCMGTCDGQCTLAAQAQVNCGANVRCRGGCSVAYTAPACETTVTPPSCNVSQTCQASCTSHVESTATCTPPGVSLECGAMVSADLQAVIDTVKKNLPSIILLVQTQGKLVLDAANQVVTTGTAVANDFASLSGKAVACAKTAVQADATASASLNVSVQASASVSGSCGGPTSGS
jgi:hypothetical protein